LITKLLWLQARIEINLHRFGYSLATGDFNDDGYDDLAIGVPSEDLNDPTIQDMGAVNVIYGSASGLSATSIPDQSWHQGSVGIKGTVGQRL